MISTIGILGCGWLGTPLAKSFIADGHTVFGTTTSEEKLSELLNEGISTFLVQLMEKGIVGNISELLQNIEVLIINVPPRLRGDHKENYVLKMRQLHRAVKNGSVKKVVFVSSTSVYGSLQGEVTENTQPKPDTESGRQLLASEAIFIDDIHLKTSVVRFGGLIGEDRHPIHMLSGKTGLSNGSEPVNLIHLDDCVAILKAIVQQEWWHETFNAVYPLHPSKRDYYSEIARKKGLPLPIYNTDIAKKGKIVGAINLLNVKNYHFHTSIVG